ncbi:MAG TPA: tetratricopeptide repeat protein [Hyphomicrobiaceae bacterium]|jgi:hypothetical protein|nr:tetratricopeptide repeat protein [Hyphomicrobiaceae bacterium]
MRRIAKILLVGLAILVLAGGGVIGWVWFQVHQVSDLRREGKYADATRLTERNLSIFEKLLWADNVFVGFWLNHLAGLYQAQGRYAEVELLFRRSLAIAEKVLGPEHPHVGGSLNNLAQLALAQGDWAQAAGLLAAQHGHNPATRAARPGEQRGGFV